MLALQANGLSMSILGSIVDPRKWQEWNACFVLQLMCAVWFSPGCFYPVYL
ncbi:MAG: hypothetical protein LLG42_09920 [Chloroflexi bacterium]|nr:hypothetical protein [Chloroflexota bacterium]